MGALFRYLRRQSDRDSVHDVFVHESTAVESTRFLADDLTSQLNTVYSLLEGMSEQLLDQGYIHPRAGTRRIHENVCGRFRLLDDRRRRSRRDHFEHLAAQNRQGAARLHPPHHASGNGKSSDPFPAGATGDMTYSQFMPIKKDGKVVKHLFRHHTPFPAQ